LNGFYGKADFSGRLGFGGRKRSKGIDICVLVFVGRNKDVAAGDGIAVIVEDGGFYYGAAQPVGYERLAAGIFERDI